MTSKYYKPQVHRSWQVRISEIYLPIIESPIWMNEWRIPCKPFVKTALLLHYKFINLQLLLLIYRNKLIRPGIKWLILLFPLLGCCNSHCFNVSKSALFSFDMRKRYYLNYTVQNDDRFGFFMLKTEFYA